MAKGESRCQSNNERKGCSHCFRSMLSIPTSNSGTWWECLWIISWQATKVRGIKPQYICDWVQTKSYSKSDILALLRKGSQEVHAETSSEFRDLCSTYIQSRTKKSGISGNTDGALWPLVRQIQIKCSSPALSSGTTLVDLPGLADTNAARSAVALEYLEKCDHICIVAPISRAVDDKIAKGNKIHTML